MPFKQVLQALGQQALHTTVFALAVLMQTGAGAGTMCKAERKSDGSIEKQHPNRLCLNIANLNFWLACSGLSVQKYTEFTAGSWRMKFQWGLIALLLNPEADGYQAGGKEMYLPVFVASGSFCCQRRLVLLNLENE